MSAEVWGSEELTEKVSDALWFAFGEAYIDPETGVTWNGEVLPVIVQYDLDTNEPIARFRFTHMGFCQVPLEEPTE